MDFLNDPQLRATLGNNLPSTITPGIISTLDLTNFMREHPSEMVTIMEAIADLKHNATSDVDFNAYDYSSLGNTIQPNGMWLLAMEHIGYSDETGNKIGLSEVHNTPGAQPRFIVCCTDMDKKQRYIETCRGLPKSDFVLYILQKAIVQPLPPFKPTLPRVVYIPWILSEHSQKLVTFLQTLPDVQWQCETRTEAEAMKEAMDALFQVNKPVEMRLAEEAKAKGNMAFAAKNRQLALRSYEEAIGHLDNVMNYKPTAEEENKVTKLLAVYWGNQAAAYLMPGPEKNRLNFALEAGRHAENANPAYAKAYVRQASAFLLLDRRDDAINVMIKALKRDELKDNVGLVDRLIEILTNGDGLSDEEPIMKQWCLDVMIGDSKGLEREYSKLGGEWARRINAQLEKVSRHRRE